MKILTIDLFGPVMLALSLWLGFTKRVPWWTIFLIWFGKYGIVVDLEKLEEAFDER